VPDEFFGELGENSGQSRIKFVAIFARAWLKKIATDGPNRNPTEGKPIFSEVEAVRAENHTRKNRHMVVMREQSDSRAEGGSGRNRSRTIPNAPFGKNTQHAALGQMLPRRAQSRAIRRPTANRKGADGTEEKGKNAGTEKFFHGHPIERAMSQKAPKRRIKMADMIGGQNPGSWAFGDFLIDDMQAAAGGQNHTEDVPPDAIGQLKAGEF
jgi:hypothetical protein